jgi:hypothetical protein
MPRPVRSPQSRVTPPRVYQPPSNGNGSPPEGADRLQQLDARIASMEKELQFQFRRIAELQVQLDRAIEARPLKPTR